MTAAATAAAAKSSRATVAVVAATTTAASEDTSVAAPRAVCKVYVLVVVAELTFAKIKSCIPVISYMGTIRVLVICGTTATTSTWASMTAWMRVRIGTVAIATTPTGGVSDSQWSVCKTFGNVTKLEVDCLLDKYWSTPVGAAPDPPLFDATRF